MIIKEDSIDTYQTSQGPIGGFTNLIVSKGESQTVEAVFG